MSNSAPRSAAKQRICDAALEHFVTYAYEGASLQQIAEMVGIRKASIYAHFANKDALFLTLLADAIAAENAFIVQCFASEDGLPGQTYCASLQQHYQDSLHFRFLLRTAYVPPEHLREHISQQYQAHLNVCQSQIMRALTDYQPHLTELETLSEAYLGVVDSLHVELLYAGSTRFEVRLQAMWRLFAHALAQPFNT